MIVTNYENQPFFAILYDIRKVRYLEHPIILSLHNAKIATITILIFWSVNDAMLKIRWEW